MEPEEGPEDSGKDEQEDGFQDFREVTEEPLEVKTSLSCDSLYLSPRVHHLLTEVVQRGEEELLVAEEVVREVFMDYSLTALVVHPEGFCIT
ncbi:hypothetical protein TURU_092432 [Turdus rufiventris]|nr:hypothetical protein TURU_092432 [Turdus rufiventris]